MLFIGVADRYILPFSAHIKTITITRGNCFGVGVWCKYASSIISIKLIRTTDAPATGFPHAIASCPPRCVSCGSDYPQSSL